MKSIFDYKHIDIIMGSIAYLISFVNLFLIYFCKREWIIFDAQYVVVPVWAIFISLAIIFRKREMGDLAWIWVSGLLALLPWWFWWVFSWRF